YCFLSPDLKAASRTLMSLRTSLMANSSDSSVLLLEGLSLDSPGAALSTFLIVLFAYTFILLSNVTISLLILLNRSLHQPLYLLYLNLSFNDLLSNTLIIPRLLADLLRAPSLRTIHLYSCVILAFLITLTNAAGYTILMIMAFDRYVAICKPLQYSALMTGRTVVRLVVWAWGLFKLSCENTYINNIYGLFFTVVLFSGSMGSMVLTYSKIMVICLRSKNASLNRRALQTCSTHLLSYLVYLFGGFLIIVFHRFPNLTQERKFITIMYHLLPSGVNPLIYGLQSNEIRRSLSPFFRLKLSKGT
uniref:Odorant receptor, family F, subfamily 115, member 15 n=1 Tax=Neogobius melanostomus TaxID=47308 RepID=A0A8C6TBM5_9GOBI